MTRPVVRWLTPLLALVALSAAGRSPEADLRDLVAKMSLEEKIGQLSLRGRGSTGRRGAHLYAGKSGDGRL